MNQVEIAKKLLESKGYSVEKRGKRLKESASVKRRYLKEGLDNSSYLYHRSNSPINSYDSAVSKEIGLHCGTREQADNLSGGYLYRIKLSDQEFMHLNYDVTGTYGSLEFLKAMKDSNSIDDSDYENLMTRLRQYGGEEDKERSYSRVYREFIIKKGYVGFVYPNSIEGEGDSYCICDSSAIEEFELVEGESHHNESRRVRGKELKESEIAISSEYKLPKSFNGSNIVAFIKKYGEVPVYNGYPNRKYVVVPADSDHIKMDTMLRSQLVDEGLYGNSFISAIVNNDDTPPYSQDNFPIYGRSDSYETKWFSRSIEAVVKHDIRDIKLVSKANAFLNHKEETNESRRVRGKRLKESAEDSKAEIGDRIRIVNNLEDYQSRGYKDNKDGYVVTKREYYGVFIKEYGYFILDTDYEIVK